MVGFSTNFHITDEMLVIEICIGKDGVLIGTGVEVIVADEYLNKYDSDSPWYEELSQKLLEQFSNEIGDSNIQFDLLHNQIEKVKEQIKNYFTRLNNLLIAEFLGFQKTETGWYDHNEILPSFIHLKEGNTFDELLFHKSWDWLIPVVQKCNQYEEFDQFFVQLDLKTGISSIDKMYDIVIQYIKIYNNEDSSTTSN